jgi:hypothetical protein
LFMFATRFSHVRARCRDSRDVRLEVSSAVGNCCNARAARFDVTS